MSWVDEVERVILEEYAVLAQCFPASDRGLECYRSLWLESVAEELGPALADPTASTALPPPYEHLIRVFVSEEVRTPASRGQLATGEATARHQEIHAFVAGVRTL